ncbi:MAG: hypothetical protein QM723_02835 [Myxococcaceae bacterium]
MLQLFKEGGVPMVAVLAFSIAALVGAVRFALRPDPRRIQSIIAMSLAVLGSTLLGVFADIAAVGHAIGSGRFPVEDHNALLQLTYQAIAECMSPLILGFGVLTVVAMLIAVGYRRLVPRLPAV